MAPYEGLLTAMVTCFADDGSVDEAATVAIGRHLLEHGSDGLVVCGTTGEAATMDDDEHLGVVRLIAEELGADTTIVAGTGSNDTRHAVHLTEAACAIPNVDAVLSVTPYYNKPNARGIKRHFEEVARAAGDTPVILYNIPGRTAVNMGPELLAELAQIDGVEAVKQANSDELQLIDGLAILAGNDDDLARALDIGGAGGICVSSHIIGDEMKRLFTEPESRAAIDAELRDVYATMFITASPAPVKAALGLLGHRVGGLRLPLVECDDAELAQVRDCLTRHGLLAGHRLSGKLRVLALGGLGEIGKNMTVVEYDGRIVVVDMGLRFPTAEMMGIDLVLPDFSYLRERVDDIEAVVITHGHEDHVGALPWILRELGETKIPVTYGGQLTVAMARSKLDEHKLREAELEVLKTGEVADAGPFEIEMVHLTHSIPDACGVALTTELGTILITGDYKFDQTPVAGAPADVSRLAEFGREGLLLLCGDSTNADRPGMSVSESIVGPHLTSLFARAKGRIVVTSFASNIHRVQQVVHAAAENGRKVALVGRSMRKNSNIGRSLGHIDIPEGLLIQPKEIDQFPDDRVVIISTGSQGEPLSALRRMAYRDHPAVELKEGDTVVFSATPIPGNERAVNEVIDRLYRVGCEVVTAKDAPIHASGHGYQEEIKLMLNLTHPRYVMPIHGDYQRLRLHSQLAQAVGVPSEVFALENGLPLEIDAKGARIGKQQTSGMIFVDGVEIGDVADVALRDRRMLSADGIFIVVATVSEQDGSSVAPPEVIARGVPFLTESDDPFIDDLRDAVEDSLDRAAEQKTTEIDVLEQMLHDDLASFIYDRLKRRPMVLPVVVEV